MPAKPPPVRLVAGPTAGGKSAFAMRLAEESDGVIVNADSMQIYRDLRILTARPTEADEAAVPHRLYGVADAADGWSVGRWLRAVTDVLGELKAEGRTAIVTGGTGLYFLALTRGLADIPAVPDSARAAAAARFDAEGEADVRRVLAAGDPAAEARIAPGDRQRLVRALSVLEATGRALSDWTADTRSVLAEGEFEAVVLEPDRAALYARCDARLDRMVEHGVLAEVRALMEKGLNPSLPALKSTGFREFAAHLRGEAALDAAMEAARRETRRFAKRQMTWFRNQTPDWPRLAPNS